MKRLNMWVAVALMAAVGMVGCSHDDTDENAEVIIDPSGEPQQGSGQKPEPIEYNELRWIELTRSQAQLVNSSNDFAFNLFRQLTDGQGQVVDQVYQPYQSEVISPISITYALGMLNNGAAGETQAQINKVLGFGDTGADGINEFCRKMLTEAPNQDKLTKLMIANTIFLDKEYQLKPDFVKKAKDYYDAEPETRDFEDGKTLDVINQWASDHTEKMIEKVLDEISPLTISYLLNAIYFKGAWSVKFDKEDTKEEPFNSYEGVKNRQTMHMTHEFGYTDNDLCQALTLPYGNGAYRMTILLPRKGKTVKDVAETLTAENWRNEYDMMGNAVVDVKLPSFESNTEADLKKIMTTLGMPDAFDEEKAEFPNFCNEPSHIGLMKQVARIIVNEEGTEAAAVTVIGAYVNSYGPSEVMRYAEFHADRPFLYVISEISTGAIFFIGQFMGN